MQHSPNVHTHTLQYIKDILLSHIMFVGNQIRLYKSLIPDNSHSQHTCNICYYKDLILYPHRICISLFIKEVKTKEVENCFSVENKSMWVLQITDLCL